MTSTKNDIELNINYKSAEGVTIEKVSTSFAGLSIQKAIPLIKEFEGCKLEAYLCPAGVWTIGYGTTQGIKKGMKITQQEAEELLIKECERFYNGVFAEVGNICNENQIGALVCFSYNVGLGLSLAETERLKQQGKKAKVGFRNSGLLKNIKANASREEVEKEFMRWVYAGGKALRGLEKRRKAEVQLYFS